MMEAVRQSWEALSANVPGLMGALTVLFAGTIAAWALALVARMGARRLDLNTRLGGEKKGEGIDAERWIHRGVFFTGFVVVLAFFFSTLKIDVITEPMNAFFANVAEYFPRLVGAAALLVAAWIVAFVLRKVATTAMNGAKLHEKLGKHIGLEKKEATQLTKTVPNAIYWITFLLFLPAVLGVLAIEGLLDPVQGLTNTVVGFLPHMLAAVVILVAGWILARILRGITVGVTGSLGLDRLSERVGIDKVLGEAKLSGVAGTIVYVFVLIPVIIAALERLQLEAITAPASAMLASILAVLPGVFSAVLILVLAYMVGRVIANLATSLLGGAGFDNILERIGLGVAPKKGQRTLSEMAGTLLLVAIMLFAGIEATRQLGFVAMADLITTFMVFAGKVVVGLVIFGLGLYLGNLANNAIRASGSTHAPALGTVARASTVVLASAIALQHMGVGQDIIKLAFAILLGAVGVAAAIAFGIGGRDVAASYLKSWSKSWNAATKAAAPSTARAKRKSTNGRPRARARRN